MSMSQFAEITGLFSKVARDYRTPFTEYSNLPFQPYEVEGRQGVSIHRLYDTRDATPPGPAAAIVRYASNAWTPRHIHPGYELLLVLEGELIDDRGRHGPGTLQIYPPESNHELSSKNGCTFLVVWEQPVQAFTS